MRVIFIIFFLSLFNNFANANDEDWIFLRCVKSSDNIKYFEVSVSKEMMIERNGFQFTFTRLTPFLAQYKNTICLSLSCFFVPETLKVDFYVNLL